MIQIDFEEIERMSQRRHEINQLKLSEIQWLLDGKPVTINHELLVELAFMGLSTYGTMEMYAGNRECFEKPVDKTE